MKQKHKEGPSIIGLEGSMFHTQKKMGIYWFSVIKLVVYKTTFIMVFLTKGYEHLIF